jgi:hypothetical protein
LPVQFGVQQGGGQFAALRIVLQRLNRATRYRELTPMSTTAANAMARGSISLERIQSVGAVNNKEQRMAAKNNDKIVRAIQATERIPKTAATDSTTNRAVF